MVWAIVGVTLSDHAETVACNVVVGLVRFSYDAPDELELTLTAASTLAASYSGEDDSESANVILDLVASPFERACCFRFAD
jgi:hypothetical protein